VAVTEVLPDEVALRHARRARVLDELEAAGVDILVVGREGNARYVSGTPRLWTAGSRAFGPGCVLVRATGAVHLLSTWDEGVPDEITHDHLYGISFNSQSFLRVLEGVEGAATARVVATDGLTGGSASLLAKAFPEARVVDGQQVLDRARRIKAPEEVEAIRAAVAVAERAVAAAVDTLAPGTTERQLTGVFMEAMARAGVTTPASQDVAWRTSRVHPWHRTGRDQPIVEGDLVAFEGGVVRGGYAGELGRTVVVGADTETSSTLYRRWRELRGRLLDACRPGATGTDLLDAYTAAGHPPPPVPIARGLGLGYDLPLVTRDLPRTAAEERLDPGTVLALTTHVWTEGVGSVLSHDPLVITADGHELLASTSTSTPGAP
jgi:Xaa-Pro dipeptidase